MRSAADPALASPAPPAARLPFIDWARGVAVLVMILAHVTDAWTRSADRSTAAFGALTILGGFAAPLFLWLAGLSLVLAGDAQLQRGRMRRDVWRRLVQRGLEVFVLAFLFRTHAFFFNPGGAAIAIFRVDILNIMGPGLAVAGLCWGAARSSAGRLLLCAALAVGIAMVTPVIRTAGWVDVLPTWFQWYLRPAGEHTVFTLFPWAGFVFGGAASGVLLAGTADLADARRRRFLLLAAGVAIIALGFGTARLPSIYRESSFWTSSPTFFAVRAGVLMVVLAGLDVLATALRPRGITLPALSRLGRGSLLVYWIHVQLVYGWATAPIHGTLSLPQVLAAWMLFSLAMYTLLPLRDRLRAAWAAQQRTDRPAPSVASV